MELPALPLLTVTPLYVALLGLIFIPYTMRVGLYRVKSKIFLGDGGDQELLRRMRGQGNFIESVPIALIMLIVMELIGAGTYWLHSLGALLVFGRLSHYIAVTDLGPQPLRPVGMVCTFTVYLVGCGWLLSNTL